MGGFWSVIASSTQPSEGTERTDAPVLQPHPTYWFDDGSMLVTDQTTNTIIRIHGSLLARQSPFFSRKYEEVKEKGSGLSGLFCNVQLGVNGQANVSLQDFIVLLEHLYHDSPLQVESKYTRIASILRITGPDVFNFPQVHALALERLNMILPSSTKEVKELQHRDALMRKFLHYDAVTALDPAPEETPEGATGQDTAPTVNGTHADPAPSSNPTPSSSASHTDSELVSSLMNRFIQHFSPTIFTPPPTSHMDCTDALAGIWLECVIQPALANDGVYRPLETLEDMKEVDWEGKGLCKGCSDEKREEWTEEQRVVWRLLDEWLVDGARGADEMGKRTSRRASCPVVSPHDTS